MILKFILVTFCVLWILSKVLKYAFRFLLIFAGKQVQKEMEKQMDQRQQQTSHQTDQYGNRIIYNDATKKGNKRSSDDGEYVDFEVID